MSETEHWQGPPLEAWSMAWTPERAAQALERVSAPWAVAGGWALDLWLGRQTREHEDLEIAVPNDFFAEIQARLENLGLKLIANFNGQMTALAPGEAPGRGFQTWVMDPAVDGWVMDVFREPGDAETWIYRRTGELSAPRAWATGRSAAGIPFVAPQIVLLFKAKAATRDKDEADFALAAPRLSPEARDWLVAGLKVVQPGHPWIDRLSA
jgi:Aminoglycoside-2''-adenylyltransferase